MEKIIYLGIAVLCVSLSFVAGQHYRSGSNEPIANPKAMVECHSSAETGKEVGGEEAAPGTVRMSIEKQQTMGVRIATVEKGQGAWRLRAPGRVVPDETRIYRIVAAVDGWVRQDYKSTTGSIVKKDEILATSYSPEFLSAQQAYIYALGSLTRFRASGKETTQQLNLTEVNVQQYKDTLRNLGMSDIQIEEIGRTRQYTENIQIRSPIAGFVSVRNISPGLRIDKGAELYRIVDLQRVWILADVFENDAQHLTPGALVKVTHPQQKRIFQARISSTLPQFDPVTRTMKVRLETPNPGFVLRPDMFVDVEFPVTVPPAIVVPSDAVLDSGVRKTVFIEQSKGCFEPREVETGRRFGNRVAIVKGLKTGERIVVSGNFLIDSESRTELALNNMSEPIAKDPVSGRKLSVRKAEEAGLKKEHRGRIYYFASDVTRQRFEQDPDRYLNRFGAQSED
jgi:membrane fusion protein, copper/silver efflux system